MNPDAKNNPNVETIELLRRVRDLLAGPEKKGSNLAKVEEAHSFTASGIGCEAWDPTAARWTVTGALAKYAMDPISWQSAPVYGLRNEILFDSAFRFLFAAAILEAPQTVNGVNNRGWDCVRDLIEFAIMLAEHGASILPVVAMPPNITPSLELRKKIQELAQAKGINTTGLPS